MTWPTLPEGGLSVRLQHQESETTMTKTNNEILDSMVETQTVEAFPWVRATVGFESEASAQAFLDLAVSDERTPDDLTGRVHRQKSYDKPSWSSGYIYPDWFQVVLESNEAGIAKAMADLDDEYPCLRRYAG